MKEKDNNIEEHLTSNFDSESIEVQDNDRLRFEVKRALLEDSPTPDAEKAYQEFLERNDLESRSNHQGRTIWLSIASMAAAACIAALLIIAPWEKALQDNSLSRSNTELAQLSKMGNVVYQASNDRPYISLCMGDKTVDLSDKSSAKDAGVLVTKDNIIRIFDPNLDNHEDVAITVPAGKTAKLMLDDGTQVSLNAGSHISFPRHFREHGTREVKLYGEAYFEVKRDETRPFIVNTDGMKTKVLGTHFNVRYFEGENCGVTLAEGSVQVYNPECDVYLKPEETAWLRSDKTLEVEPADMEQALGWLNGEFYFDGQTLKDIMTEIGRWYNLNVVFANDKHLQEQLHFSADRTAPIQEIIRQLQMIGNAHIELKSQEHALYIK